MNMSSYNCCTPDKSEFKRIVSLASLLKIVAEESRLKLLCILKNEEHCVCEIMGHLDMTQSLISHHLADLKAAGLVKDEKRGQRVYYQLTKLGSKVMALLEGI
jgi:ArsR family transcriptional regulator